MVEFPCGGIAEQLHNWLGWERRTKSISKPPWGPAGVLGYNLSQGERRHQSSQSRIQWVVGAIKIDVKISKKYKIRKQCQPDLVNERWYKNYQRYKKENWVVCKTG